MHEPSTPQASLAAVGPATDEQQAKLALQGWGFSGVLHAVVTAALFGLVQSVAPVVKEPPFRWEVSLATPVKPSPAPSVTATEPAPPVQSATGERRPHAPPQPVVDTPRAVPTPVEARTAQTPIARQADPVQRLVETLSPPPPVEEIKPTPIIARTVQARQEVQARDEVGTHEVVRAQRELQAHEAVSAREMGEPIVEHVPMLESTAVVSHQSARVREAAPVVETPVPAPVETAQPVVEARAEPIMRATVPAAPAEASTVPAAASDPPSATQSAESSAKLFDAPTSPTLEPDLPPLPTAEAPELPSTAPPGDEHLMVARATPPPTAHSRNDVSPAKADYRWLAESLHRRIVELRHYPSTARLNGWEGKVVLRVTLRQDGQLEAVTVVKSSGHEVLDNAAIEAVRRACPLHLKRELAAPMVVVQVPINYNLHQ